MNTFINNPQQQQNQQLNSDEFNDICIPPQMQMQNNQIPNNQQGFPSHSNPHPEDTVSCIQWMPPLIQQSGYNNQPPPAIQGFAIGCWDGKVKVYWLQSNISTNNIGLNISRSPSSDPKLCAQNSHLEFIREYAYTEPILCLAWKNDSSIIFAGAADGAIIAYPFTQDKSMQIQPILIGNNTDAVHGIFYSIQNYQQQQLLYSVQDQSLKIWDIVSTTATCNKEISLDHGVICADFRYPIMAIGLSSFKIVILNMSKLDQCVSVVNNPLNKPMHYFESELKTDISCIKINFENGVWSLAYGSGDGRSYIGTFKENLHMPGKFEITKLMVFRDQFEETVFLNGKAQEIILYPVTALQFCKRKLDNITTSGLGGQIKMYATEQKQKNKCLNFGKQHVTCMSIEPSGEYMAYSLGNGWLQGIESLQQNLRPKIFVHPILNIELTQTKQ